MEGDLSWNSGDLSIDRWPEVADGEMISPKKEVRMVDEEWKGRG